MKQAVKKMGRPTKFRPEMVAQAHKIALLGCTDAQLANIFGVNEDTIYAWKISRPEFSEALKSGKLLADANIGKGLYQRALGYSHPEEKIFVNEGEVIRVDTVKHYPPETTACIFWLKNRQPELWRDVKQIDNRHTFGTVDVPTCIDWLGETVIEGSAIEVEDLDPE